MSILTSKRFQKYFVPGIVSGIGMAMNCFSLA